MAQYTPDDEVIKNQIQEIVRSCGGDPDTFDGELITQLLQTSLKLMIDKHDTGQLKVMNRSLKEMRYAYRVFNKYKGSRCISIFGSARTPETHPDYIAAKEFSRAMAKEGWMCITGGANGIMKAGHEGPLPEQNFGLSIRLPFESTTNAVMEGDPKLIIFRYFFIRKLMFMSHSDAMAAFPGGYGTMDELFEMLTLIQTGKANVIPIVLIEGQDGVFWKNWEEYIEGHLLKNGWISPEDQNLYHICQSYEEGIQEIKRFYHRYHSSRYVKDNLVIRLLKQLKPEQFDILNNKFSRLVLKGKIEPCNAYPEENDFLDLPRTTFQHTRKDFGILRKMIDEINAFPN